MGAGLIAMARECQHGWAVEGPRVLASGKGNAPFDDVSYPFWAQDGGTLAGARFDSAIDTKREVGPRDRDVAGSPLRTPADVALSADDGETVANETRTHVLIDGNAYSLATLLGGGTAAHQEQTYIDEVRGEVDDLYQQVKTLADINASLDKADRSDFSVTYDRKWGKDAQKAVDKIFGPAVVDLGDLVRRAGKVDEETMLEDFEELLDAMSSLEAFSAALEQDGLFEDGENALLANDRTAAQVFDAREAETQVILEAEGATRFGVFAQSGRNIALDKLEFKMDAIDPDKDQGGIGAFAYSTAALVTRSSFLPSAGVARYTGGTTAVNAAKEPTLSGSSRSRCRRWRLTRTASTARSACSSWRLCTKASATSCGSCRPTSRWTRPTTPIATATSRRGTTSGKRSLSYSHRGATGSSTARTWRKSQGRVRRTPKASPRPYTYT